MRSASMNITESVTNYKNHRKNEKRIKNASELFFDTCGRSSGKSIYSES